MTRTGGLSRRRAETRRRLIEAAYEVFSELGIRDAPVELICDRAGFSRGAFYSNFASKEELFLALYEVQMEQRADRLLVAVSTAAASTPADVTAVAEKASALFADSVAADTTWYLLYAEFRAQALRQPELRAATAAAEQRFHQVVAEILFGMLDRLGARLTVDPRSAVVTITALYEAMLERTLIDESPESGSRYLTEVLPRLVGALIAPAE
ncbi:TetR/AcrR family transcriptional regulator [Saccharothrix sp. AJ9571]|nr:TetR/AcrR family transcriptional regulator [Saccharothrix sp. AJ9571]